jgi:hypothetical protein
MKFFNTLKEFISYFNTPFIRPKIRFYFGKIAIGTPFFYPRRSVKDPDKPGYLKFIPKKFGFDIVKLGWKTKWSQYRFEWSPIISFVFFKWQIAITIEAPEMNHYWESWLYYQYKTDKKSSKIDRAIQCQKEYPQNWLQTLNGVKKKINFYEIILKKKYVIKSIEEVREDKINSLLN